MSNMIENMKDHTLYKDAHEKLVKRHVVYANSSDGYAYLDPEYTKPISCHDLLNMVLDGIVINLDVDGQHLVFPAYVCINQNGEGVDYLTIHGTNHLGNAYGVHSEEYDPMDNPR